MTILRNPITLQVNRTLLSEVGFDGPALARIHKVLEPYVRPVRMDKRVAYQQEPNPKTTSPVPLSAAGACLSLVSLTMREYLIAKAANVVQKRLI